MTEAPLPADPADTAASGRPALEVADIVRAHGAAFLARHGSGLSTVQRRALADVAACRALLAVWAVAQVVVGVLGSAEEAGGGQRRCCPVCGSERWLVVAELPPGRDGTAERSGSAPAAPDTS